MKLAVTPSANTTHILEHVLPEQAAIMPVVRRQTQPEPATAQTTASVDLDDLLP